MILLRETLAWARDLTHRGREELSTDPLLQLSAEAIVMRTGDLAKKLMLSDPELANVNILQHAARARDFVAHHYHRVDIDLLWQTVSTSLVDLDQWLSALDQSTHQAPPEP